MAEQLYRCQFCDKSKPSQGLIGKTIELDLVNIIHCWPNDICICKECIKILKEMLNEYRRSLINHPNKVIDICEHSGILGTPCDKDNCNSGCLS